MQVPGRVREIQILREHGYIAIPSKFDAWIQSCINSEPTLDFLDPVNVYNRGPMKLDGD